MKRAVITVAAAAVLTFGLTACGGSDTSTPVADPGPTAETTAAAKKPIADDDIFLAVVRPESPEAGPAHIDLAHNICDALDAGATMDQVGMTLLASSDYYTPEQLGTLAGAAVGTYCPEHSTGGDTA